MKNIFLILVSVLTIFTSCKKEKLLIPSTPITSTDICDDSVNVVVELKHITGNLYIHSICFILLPDSAMGVITIDIPAYNLSTSINYQLNSSSVALDSVKYYFRIRRDQKWMYECGTTAGVYNLKYTVDGVIKKDTVIGTTTSADDLFFVKQPSCTDNLILYSTM